MQPHHYQALPGRRRSTRFLTLSNLAQIQTIANCQNMILGGMPGGMPGAGAGPTGAAPGGSGSGPTIEEVD
jgi:hypothetical protein